MNNLFLVFNIQIIAKILDRECKICAYKNQGVHAYIYVCRLLVLSKYHFKL